MLADLTIFFSIQYQYFVISRSKFMLINYSLIIIAFLQTVFLVFNHKQQTIRLYLLTIITEHDQSFNKF